MQELIFIFIFFLHLDFNLWSDCQHTIEMLPPSKFLEPWVTLKPQKSKEFFQNQYCLAYLSVLNLIKT